MKDVARIAGAVMIGLQICGSELSAQDRPATTANLAGCYQIDLFGWYEHPMTRESGPYLNRPDHYKGIPEQVQLTVSEDGAIDVATVAPDSVDSEWMAELTGDTLRLGWGLAFWGLHYALEIRREALRGLTWYWSDVVMGEESKRVYTVWRRIECPGAKAGTSFSSTSASAGIGSVASDAVRRGSGSLRRVRLLRDRGHSAPEGMDLCDRR